MAQIKKAYINTESGQIHYRYLSGKGTPLLFFHRTPASSIMFEKMMLEMKDDRPMYAFDTPGFGESFNPEGMPSLIDYRDWLSEAIDAIGIEKFHIYAHHTGTHIASEIVLERPEKVLSLCLNGAAYLTAEERQVFKDNFTPALEPDEDGNYLLNTFNLIKTLFPDFDPELVDLELRGALRSKQGRNQAFTAIWEQDFIAVLKKITCPVFVMSAEDDFFIEQVALIANAHPEINTAVLDQSRIVSPELRTKEIVGLIRPFMNRSENN